MMTGPDLTLLVLLACGAQGTHVDAETARPCVVDDARDAPEGGPGEVAGGPMQAQGSSQEGQPAEAKPREVFYSVTIGAGFSHNSTSGEFVRFSAWKPGKHGVTLDVGERHGGDESSVGFGGIYWRNLDPKTTLSLSANGGTAPFAARYGVGASISRPFVGLGWSLGVGHTEWHDGNYVTEVGLGAQRWLPHVIIGGGATYSQGQPARFTGWRGSVGATYFTWKKTYASIGVDFGKVRNRDWQYNVVSKGLNLGFSQWFHGTSGISVAYGKSLDMDVYGVSVSWFKEW